MATHIERTVGQSIFGLDVAGYQEGRLDYPVELFDLLSDRCGLAQGCKIFEVGPGTGQATHSLLGREAHITAIEPDPALALALGDLPVRATAALHVVNAMFEEAQLPVGGFDLGVAATSFGWLDAPSALRKARTALRGGGWWAMWWNIFHDLGGDPIMEEAVADLPRPAAFRSGSHFSLDVPARLAELSEAGFVEAEYLPVRRSLQMTPQMLRALYATFSPLRLLSPDDYRRRLDRVEERASVEARDGLITRTYLTTLYIGRNP